MPDPKFLQHATAVNNPLAGQGITLPGELGYAAQSVPPETVTPGASQVGAAGTLFLRRMSLPGPMVVSTLAQIISVAGATLTANQNFAVLYDGAGQLIGITADQSVNWTGTGLNVMALTAPAGSPGLGIDTPYCYAGFWWNGTTSPLFARGGTADIALVNGQAAVPASQARAVSANSGLTTAATVPLTLGALTKIANTHGNLYWALT